MQFSGESSQVGVPTQPMSAHTSMAHSGAGQFVAGVWQAVPHTLELREGKTAHIKAETPAMVVGVGSTLQPAHTL